MLVSYHGGAPGAEEFTLHLSLQLDQVDSINSHQADLSSPFLWEQALPQLEQCFRITIPIEIPKAMGVLLPEEGGRSLDGVEKERSTVIKPTHSVNHKHMLSTYYMPSLCLT